MRGRPPTPLHLKIIRGNPGKRPLRAEAEPEVPSAMPDAPEFLTGYACDEWYRAGTELHRLGLLTVLDCAAFAAYCRSYGLWRTAEEALQAMADRDPVTGAMLIRGSGGPQINPLLKLARHAALDMLRYASEFGLTPTARARIAAAPFTGSGGGSKFDGLLG